MTPKRMLLALIILFAVALGLLIFNTTDHHQAEQQGVGLPASTQSP